MKDITQFCQANCKYMKPMVSHGLACKYTPVISGLRRSGYRISAKGVVPLIQLMVFNNTHCTSTGQQCSTGTKGARHIPHATRSSILYNGGTLESFGMRAASLQWRRSAVQQPSPLRKQQLRADQIDLLPYTLKEAEQDDKTQQEH